MQVMKKTKVRAKRGEIVEFSRHARKRLQNALLMLNPPSGWVRFGLCVTVPAQCDDWQDDWLKTVKRFWDYLSRNIVDFAGIYRVELQQRGMPHMHIVMFSSASHWQLAAGLAMEAWRNSLDGWKIDGKRVSDGWINGVTAQPQEITYANSFRYLYDHESKQKQAQLGYKGKQWGVFARKWLSSDIERVDLTEAQRIALYRILRKWSKKFYKGKNRGRLTRIRPESASYNVPLSEELKLRLLAHLSHVAEGEADRVRAEDSTRETACPRLVESVRTDPLHRCEGGGEQARPFVSPRKRSETGASGTWRSDSLPTERNEVKRP